VIHGRRMKIGDISKPDDQLVVIDSRDLIEIPGQGGEKDELPCIPSLTAGQLERLEVSLDGVSAIGIPKPKNKEEEDELVRKFLAGIEKLFSVKENWTLLQPLKLSLDNCASCQTCSDACPIYVASGRQEIYRPTYRSDLLRAIVARYVRKAGK
jgi:hypothetical protein